MTSIITKNDRKYLGLSIQAAEQACKDGNYPVGAALVIDGKMVETSGNKIKEQKSFVHHAENLLIIKNAKKLYEAFEKNKQVVLYSTLEPCIQCLGAVVTNHVNKIVYIQKDPNGGACDLKHDNIGQFYREKWPKIIYAPVSKKPLKLMLGFFHSEVKNGNKKWPSKMLSLLKE